MQQAKSNKSNLGYERLVAWQLADKLAWEIYCFTDKFPKDESFGLTSQLRRAALSIPLNIVEGYARAGRNEFRQFLKISLGSLSEVDYLLKFSLKRKYLTENEYAIVIELRNDCAKVVWSLMKSQ